jgi:hypothetical protein
MPSPGTPGNQGSDGQSQIKQIDLGTSMGGWRWNDWKVKQIKQGSPSGDKWDVGMLRACEVSTSGGQSVRMSNEAR